MDGIKLIVGLGNPGDKYAATRHNAGFWFIDAIAAQTNCKLAMDVKMFGFVGKFEADKWLLKPTTFMNDSGKAVAALANYYKIKPAEILIVHDELDLQAGSIKLKFGGGHGGHNGLRDIHSRLGTPDYWRLRLGIGHPGVKSQVVDYVLREPSSEERDAVCKCIEQSLGALDALLAGEMERAMMLIHAKPARPKPPRRDIELA